MHAPAVLTRAIPTRVGKSGKTILALNFGAGHPHAGGEITKTRTQADADRGPSPRGWGNLAPPHQRLDLKRAIPTRVGKSCLC